MGLSAPPIDGDLERAQDSQIRHEVLRASRLCGCQGCVDPANGTGTRAWIRQPCATRAVILDGLLVRLTLVERKDEAAATSDEPVVSTIVFIINGEEVSVDATFATAMKIAKKAALERSGNTGRAPAEWRLRDINGHAVDEEQTVEQLDVRSGARFFVTLDAGVGGAA